ncbi:hypothetical protein PPTG_22428 [Phytophthora nicotianae INRA-310]|uniref:Uncharacterized protein n=1 Tax=Phytophthora nicotianae (strain INRA-310) TaxID=761204 RepID=W2QIA6_PHYN3|nr:hypothetical protein PPTG_22428 [Phytophthora nicotianae INRA-310]ETN12898.1 hypothetical protein PPTG_22428 [Phytophthora nicotianae INRA-310]
MEDPSIPETEAKAIISDYFIEAGKSDSIFPIHLLPLTIGKANKKYYFSTIDGNLRVRNKDVKKHPPLSGEAHTGFFKRIRWTATLELLIKYFDEMEAFLNSDHGVDKATKEPIMSAIRLYMYVLKAHGVKIRSTWLPEGPPEPLRGLTVGGKLKGRGLLGAGMKPLEGVSRNKGQTYNLNDIQGLATPSAYIYRKLGSKFIRLPDLDKRTLTIVQPNRRKVGPMRQISDSLQSMIKDLVFKNKLSQEKYDKLSVDDKKLFKEILSITHLQYNFSEQLEDPLESLRMEYDKLKGEVMLGNDNPSILKQLKVVCVDMYSNKLISDSEFKNIITRLL